MLAYEEAANGCPGSVRLGAKHTVRAADHICRALVWAIAVWEHFFRRRKDLLDNETEIFEVILLFLVRRPAHVVTDRAPSWHRECSPFLGDGVDAIRV